MADEARSLAVVSAGLRDPSSTSLLARRLAETAERELGQRGHGAQVTWVEVRDHAQDLTNALLTGFPAPGLRQALEQVAAADGLIAVSPIFSGSYTGLFKTFFDVLGEDSLTGVPVLLGATAGTPRHSLAIEHALRPLLTYLRALTVPTGVFAATEDFGQSSPRQPDVIPLGKRIDRAAAELAELMATRPRREPPDPFRLTASFEELLTEG